MDLVVVVVGACVQPAKAIIPSEQTPTATSFEYFINNEIKEII